MPRTITRLFSLVVGIAVVVWLSSTSAHATTILCGYMTNSMPVAATSTHSAGTAVVGIFYKIRTEDASYKDKCKNAQSAIEVTIKGMTKTMPPGTKWSSENKEPCDHFKYIFYSGFSSVKKSVCDSISNIHTVQAETDIYPAVPSGWDYKKALSSSYKITTSYQDLGGKDLGKY